MRGGSLRCSWTHKYLTEKLFFDVSTLTISRCLVVQLVVVEIGRVKLYPLPKKKHFLGCDVREVSKVYKVCYEVCEVLEVCCEVRGPRGRRGGT